MVLRIRCTDCFKVHVQLISTQETEKVYMCVYLYIKQSSMTICKIYDFKYVMYTCTRFVKAWELFNLFPTMCKFMAARTDSSLTTINVMSSKGNIGTKENNFFRHGVGLYINVLIYTYIKIYIHIIVPIVLRSLSSCQWHYITMSSNF